MNLSGGAAPWRVLAVLLILAAAIARLILLVQPIGGDPALYAYVASRILEGEVPYRDVFEQKPPGVLYTYALAFLLGGRTMTAVQVLDLSAWAAVVPIVAAIAWTLWKDRPIAWASATLAAIFVNPNLQSGFKQVAQSETFIAVAAAAACLVVLRRSPDESRPTLAAGAVGILCGLAFLFKYNAGTYLVAASAALGLTARGWGAALRRLSAVLAGFVGTVLVPVIWFARHGALDDLFEATVLYNLGYAAAGQDSVFGFLGRALVFGWRFATTNFIWLTGGAGMLLALWQAWRQRQTAPLTLIAFIVAAWIAIVINGRLYPQYFLQALPLLVPLSAFALATAWRWSATPRRWPIAVVLVLAVGFELARHTQWARFAGEVRSAALYRRGDLTIEDYYLGFGGFADGGDFSMLADYQLAERIRTTTRPDDTVYIYGGEALVLFLSDRRSPSRFVWNDPFVAGRYRDRYGTEDLIAELSAAPPAYFIVLSNDANAVDPLDGLAHYRADRRLRQWVNAHYRELGWLEDFLIFERQ